MRLPSAVLAGSLVVMGGWLESPSLRAAELDACPAGQEAAAGPLLGGSDTTAPADFAAIPEACPGSDLLLRLRGSLVDDAGAPGFYGNVLSDAMLRGRRRLGGRGWLSLAVDFVTFRFVDNANLVSTGVSFGPATLAYHEVVFSGARSVVAAYARFLLPIDTARQAGIETGAEMGASGRRRVRRRWMVDGGAAIVAPVDVTGGEVRARLEPLGLGEAWFSPRPRLALMAGASARVEVTTELRLVGVAPRIGLRGTLRRGFWLAFLAEAPVAGPEHPGAHPGTIVGLYAGWTPSER